VGTVDLEGCHAGTVEPAERIYKESYVVIEGDRGNVFAAVMQKSKIIFNWSTHIFQVSFLLFCILSHSLR
jgi:hypothetical protein